jgi:hypothetical protein
MGARFLIHPLFLSRGRLRSAEPVWHIERMNRTAVTSSSLASIGYSPTQATLEVEFKHGAIYQYLDVPADVFDAFIAADSKGTFFNRAVKDCYSHQRVSR